MATTQKEPVKFTGKATLAALEADQNADWAIGDAMVQDGLKSRSNYAVIAKGQVDKGLKPKSYNTLRQYNATASYWPKDRRFQSIEWTDKHGVAYKGDVVFGVHKIAMEGLSLADAENAIQSVLRDVDGDPHKVSVSKVKAAVKQIKLSKGIATGAVSATAATATPKAEPKVTATAYVAPLNQIQDLMRQFTAAELEKLNDREFEMLAKTHETFVKRMELVKAKKAKKAQRAKAPTKQVGRVTPQPKKAAPTETKADPKKDRKKVRGGI